MDCIRLGIADKNVGADTGVEQVRPLRQTGDESAQLLCGEVADLHPSQPDTALVIAKPQQKLHQGTLAAAARPYQRHPFSLRQVEVEALQYLFIFPVSEADVAQLYCP